VSAAQREPSEMWSRAGGPTERTSGQPLLIVGGLGTLGRTFRLACEARGVAAVALSRHECDITDPAAVRAAVQGCHPWAIVNAAGYARIDEAERDQRACRRVNAVGPAILAAVCRGTRLPLLTFSSDLVFDGSSARPYVESDPVYPQTIYGRTKAEAERRVLALSPASLVVRSGPLFGPLDRRSFLLDALDTLRSGSSFHARSDLTMSPTYGPDLVNASLDLLINGAHGIWHLANAGAITWAEFARRAARVAGLDEEAIVPTAPDATLHLARRPPYSALSTERGQLLRVLDEAMSDYLRDRDVRDASVAGGPAPSVTHELAVGLRAIPQLAQAFVPRGVLAVSAGATVVPTDL
jgi:dTDP-4-dehydrorhamnose reductase